MKLCSSCHTLYGDEFDYCPRDESPLSPAPKETLAMYDPMRGLLLEGRYRLLAPVGSGTLGEVYSAMFESMEKPVAVKILRAEYAKNPGWSEKFLQLAQLQSQVENRHLVPVTDFGTTPDGRPFFVMEWISGEHLGEYVRRQGPLPPAEAIHIVRQIASALQAAHARGLVHQNLKPSNVRLAPDGAGGRKVFVTDLGLFTPAAGTDTVMRQELQLYGNPRFMAPEQVRGMPPAPSMDIYQLGLLMYTLLAGEPPFSGKSFQELAAAQVQMPPAPLPSNLPQHLRELVFRMLEKDPARRPADIAEILQYLDSPGTSRMRRMRLLAAVAALAAAAAAIFWIFASKQENAAPEETKHKKEEPAPSIGNMKRPPAPEEDRVRILIDSVPSGARIFIGNQVQRAPAWFELPRSEQPVAGHAELPGRPPLEFQLVPRRFGQVFLHLESGMLSPKGPMAPSRIRVEPELIDPYAGK